jgi:hypothetical protein
MLDRLSATIFLFFKEFPVLLPSAGLIDLLGRPTNVATRNFFFVMAAG